MADSRDILGKNRKFTGTGGIKLPVGTQAQRVDEQAQIRFNTDTNLAEYYNGTEWKPIDAPPTITAISPASPVDDGSTVTEITITGSNLQSGGTLSLIGNDATVYSVSSFTLVSSSSITFNYTSALAAAGVNTPYDVRYVNPSGLSAIFENNFTPNTGPVWASPAAGSSLGSISIGANASTFTQISVTDTSGGTLVYSISDGALPGGASINSSTGAISGVTNASGTFTFTIQVTDGTTAIERQFTATVTNPFITATGGTVTESGDYKIHTFTGDGCFTVSGAGCNTTSGPSTVDYLVVAGGGAGGNGSSHGGGGGAGGYREAKAASSPTHTASPHTASPLASSTGIVVTASTYPITVGGGAPQNDTNPSRGVQGSSSIFSTITSAGGGGGGAWSATNGGSGGSGGGSAQNGNPTGGAGNTPPVNPPQGQNGGGNNTSSYMGGGGGAGQAGGFHSGGNGVSSSITGSPVTRGGGGGGGGNSSFPPGTGGSGGGGPGSNTGPVTGTAGTAGTGGGGGGQSNPPGGGGAGGSGIVVIRYKFQ